jgi:hypothetical protein
MLEATAHEKYERTKEQALPLAELILAARVAEAPAAEAEQVKAFLNSIYAGLKVDDDPELLDSRFTVAAQRRKKLTAFVEQRASELMEAMHKLGSITPTDSLINIKRVASLLSHHLTDSQIGEAKEQYDKTIEEFVDKEAEISVQPISRILEDAGLPLLAESIVEELYKDEAVYLSKRLSDPLFEVAFHPTATIPEEALTKVARVANRPTFDEASLPPEIVNPSSADRVKVRAQRQPLEERFPKVRVLP